MSQRRTATLIPSTVYVRLRPKVETGGHADGDAVEKWLDGWTHDTISLADRHDTTRYTFPTRVLGPEVSQDDVDRIVLPPLMQSFLTFEGTDVMLFAYGQTGTGKTHTMFGPIPKLVSDTFEPDWGLLPRIVYQTHAHIENNTETTIFHLHASALEFFQGQVCD
mmetsp:Transcript_26215/g.53171  ORF Transcript_26215/g.53171 Transcript_26215/m.53171 type:complete len:164 (+) Transcript_26215:207-698(+)